ncbi:MAG TPA: PilZ domain-containing protein [Gammaproteobacteria bacterium]|nr:PilZ domain-containing protein [Gammaproteobacteria bacterium]
MSSAIDNNKHDQRAFPRITVTCPVLYLLPSAKRWQVARLVDFSATGISMVCDDKLNVGAEISLQIKPGSQKIVPALSATGIVMRSETNNEQQYVISCKLTKVQR